GAGRPASAAYAASEAAVLPVDAHDTARAPMRRAWVTPTVMPRSLNEPVGLRPSCFRRSAGEPAQCAPGALVRSGVFPSGKVSLCSPAVDSTASTNRHTPGA